MLLFNQNCFTEIKTVFFQRGPAEIVGSNSFRETTILLVSGMGDKLQGQFVNICGATLHQNVQTRH